MFVMANDGGVLHETGSRFVSERVLCQRVFFFQLLSRGIAVTLFKGVEYRDSKVSRHHLDVGSQQSLTWTI